MPIIKIRDIIHSSSANTGIKGDLVIKEIQNQAKEDEKITLDFEKIELINLEFLNNITGNLFNPREYNLTRKLVRVENMDDNMIELLKESVLVAREKSYRSL